MGVASVFSKLPYTHIMDRFSHSRMRFAKGIQPCLPTSLPRLQLHLRLGLHQTRPSTCPLLQTTRAAAPAPPVGPCQDHDSYSRSSSGTPSEDFILVRDKLGRQPRTTGSRIPASQEYSEGST